MTWHLATDAGVAVGGGRCSSCGGVYHPATGHRASARTLVCGPCTRSFIAWLKPHLHRRWGGLRFYEHAVSSVKASL